MYKVVLNSDRVHISRDGVPVETFMFSQFADDGEDGKAVAVGIAVCKALAINGTSVEVVDLGKG